MKSQPYAQMPELFVDTANLQTCNGPVARICRLPCCLSSGVDRSVQCSVEGNYRNMPVDPCSGPSSDLRIQGLSVHCLEHPVMCVVSMKEDLLIFSLRYVGYEVGRRVWAWEFHDTVALMKSGAVTTSGHPVIW